MKYTQNYNLRKPEDTDPADIQDLNYNADAIDGKLKEIEDWEAAHLQASNPHSITPALIGAETPQGAQARVDVVAGRVDALEQDYSEHKSDYELNKDTVKLKVAKLEQEVKRYKELYEQSNPTQSPRVTSTGYGVVSLPKNAGQGPMDVKVEGLTLKNELDYNPDTWEEWVLADNASISNGLVFAGTGVTDTTFLNINAKSNTKYGLLFNVLKNSINGNFRMSNSLTGATESLFVGGFTGPFKKILVTQGVIVNNNIGFNLSSATTEGEVKISDIRLFELPPGSEIESDFETLSAAELAMKYPYVQGGERRNTSGTFRVRSVGKNLFDASKTWYYGTYSNGIVQAKTGLSNIATFPVTLTSANRSIFRVYLCKENTPYTVSISNFASTDINISLTQYPSIESAVSYTNALASTNASGLDKKATLTTVSGGNILLVAISGNYNTLQTGDIVINGIGLVQLEEGTTATAYEPYTESEQYVIGEPLRSFPNGSVDIIENGKLIKRVGNENASLLTWQYHASSTNANYWSVRTNTITVGANAVNQLAWTNYEGAGIANFTTYTNADNLAYYVDANGLIYIKIPKSEITGDIDDAKTKEWLANRNVSLIYLLATSIETPVQVSGSVQSYPNGTVYIEPAIADAGVYDGGFAILNTDFPIAELESVQKIDFQTGLSTELDVGQAVIAGGGLSFTHPGLTDGDIVFVTYLYDDSNYTAGKATLEYYDSRFVLKDDVTGKFYRKVETVEDGELVTQLVEV